MQDQDTPEYLVINGLGQFKLERIAMNGEDDQDDDPMDDMILFTKEHTFQGQITDLIVYANDDGSWPSNEQRAELIARFKRFEDTINITLKQLPGQVRTLLKLYDYDIDHLSDSQIINDINWDNIKLEPDGPIECYTSIPCLPVSFDIVMRFSPPDELEEVYSDG